MAIWLLLINISIQYLVCIFEDGNLYDDDGSSWEANISWIYWQVFLWPPRWPTQNRAESQWDEYAGLFVTSSLLLLLPAGQTKTSRTNIDLPYIPVLIMKIVIAKNICLQCYCRLLMEWWIEWSFFPFDDLVKNWNLTVLQPKQHFSSGKFTKGCRIVQWDEYAGLFVTSPPPASCCLPAKPRHLGWKNGLDREKVHCGLQMLPTLPSPVAKTMIAQ